MLFWYYFVNFNLILEDLSSSELPVGPMSLDFSQWQDESLFYMPIELSFV